MLLTAGGAHIAGGTRCNTAAAAGTAATAAATTAATCTEQRHSSGCQVFYNLRASKHRLRHRDTAAASRHFLRGCHLDVLVLLEGGRGRCRHATGRSCRRQPQQQEKCRALLSKRGKAGRGAGFKPCTLCAATGAVGAGAPVDLLAGLSDGQLAAKAEQWGYIKLGKPLPEGVSRDALAGKLPPEVYTIKPALAWGRTLLPACVMALGYAYLWYNYGIAPLLGKLLSWAAIGTGYFGVFVAATDCAHFSFLPEQSLLQEVVGATLMMPSLYSFEAWRLQYFNHVVLPNMWGEDTQAWHPVSVAAFRSWAPWRQRLWRAVFCTPLKLLASIGHWCRSFDGFDLKLYHPPSRLWMLVSWALPLGFMAVVWPAIIASGGLAAWASCWLMPWLVFHGWLSLVTLIHHTAPHIPFVGSGPEYDEGRAAISGTVTLHLPRWLALVVNDANYHVPQHLSSAIPFYNLRAAYGYLSERLGPYMTECTLNPTLLTNLITAWQLYDERQHTYVGVDEALDMEDEDDAQESTSRDAQPSGTQCNGAKGDNEAAAWHEEGHGASREASKSDVAVNSKEDMGHSQNFDDAYTVSRGNS